LFTGRTELVQGYREFGGFARKKSKKCKFFLTAGSSRQKNRKNRLLCKEQEGSAVSQKEDFSASVGS
jgi:hypothetical protein